ncbi:MAG TPA: hypothetical protein VMT24_15250 [Aggregatilineaceae bacterium]|nr:hypothetical protein [Aggregatilineaceae bacterium]
MPLAEVTLPDKVQRIPFRALLEAGYLAPGDRLYLDDPVCEALILEGGDLACGDHRGSIHRLAAQLKAAPSCNGWKHWQYVDRETGQRLLLDTLRTRLRSR